MAKQNINSKKGFTIIEVVLVLAIAGLIFLMVFVALPALQRSQRDTARRNDMSRVDTSLVQYQTNNQSASTQYPGAGVFNGKTDALTCTTSACKFVREYMNSGSGNATENEFKDPAGTAYSVVITENYNKAPATGLSTTSLSQGSKSKLVQENGGYTITGDAGAFDEYVVYIVPGSECDGPVAKKALSENHFSVLYRLEGAGVYCIDDQ